MQTANALAAVASSPCYCPDQASAKPPPRAGWGNAMGRTVKTETPAAPVSRRTMLIVLGSAASSFVLEGCASLADSGVRLDAGEVTTNPTLLVATTRKAVNGARAKPWFGTERAARVSIARAKLIAPGDGRFSMASIGLDDWRLDAIETVPKVGDLLGHAGGRRDVLVYVHGFNQTFETAALDAARLSDGIRFHGETMVFSWPSKAKLFDYGYDRESAMWSRDALEEVLSGLITSPAVGRIHIVAHSIGTMLTMEGIRQIYDRHGGVVAERIGALVFASPDIDINVFSSSVERIGPMASKITVITATNDRALAVSGWLAGGITRVGAAEQAELKRMGLHVIDASKEGWGIINHDLFLSNAQIRQVIRRAIDRQPLDGA
jgi:esterase/lipase superfamily enzyme